MKIQYINKLEKQNQNVSVKISGYEEKKIFPVLVTENKGRRYYENLLLINNENTYRNILIRDFSRLPSSQCKGLEDY